MRRFYICTTMDQAVGPMLQKKMYTAQPVERVFTIASDHSSYVSAPDELIEILLEIQDTVGSAAP